MCAEAGAKFARCSLSHAKLLSRFSQQLLASKVPIHACCTHGCPAASFGLAINARSFLLFDTAPRLRCVLFCKMYHKQGELQTRSSSSLDGKPRSGAAVRFRGGGRSLPTPHHAFQRGRIFSAICGGGPALQGLLTATTRIVHRVLTGQGWWCLPQLPSR